MKNLILIILLSIFSHLCFGQKMLNEVKVQNLVLEEISPSSIPDVKIYQKQKFKSPKGQLAEIDFRSHKYSKLYKLKGSDDLVEMTPNLDKRLFEDWDKTVGGYIETFTVSAPASERYTEHLKGQGYKAVIFFVKDYKLGNINTILYQNLDAKITLFITYISNSPDNVKIGTMRKIVREMKFN